MGNIYNTPPDFDTSDPENLKTSEVFADKHTRIVEHRNVRILSNMLARFYVQELLEELTVEFLGKRKGRKQISEIHLIKILKKLRKSIELLMSQNESQNYHFIQSLSELWNLLLQFLHQSSLLPNPPQHASQLKTLMKQIFQYPKNSEHTFGYYLNGYAGEKWLPFPFMDLLNKLHEEALLNGPKSTLGSWKRALNLIIDPLTDKD